MRIWYPVLAVTWAAAFAACGGGDDAPTDEGLGGSGGSGGQTAGAGSGGDAEDPTSQTDDGSLLMGAEGGLLMGEGVSLNVPAGALDREVTLVARRLDQTSTAALPTPSADGLEGAGTLVGAPLAFTPHGTSFAQAVEVEVQYSGQANVVMRLDDENDDSWELVDGAVVTGGIARFAISGFSIYAVAAATRACQRETCASLPASLECGLVDDDCGGQVDLQSDCARPACAENESCRADNTCGPCQSSFSCATTTAECGIEVDNCGVSHDVVAECANVNGCGANGTCSNINLCGECTPYADCAAALAAAADSCNPAVPDGCGGSMDCSGTCEQGKSCFYTVDEYADGGGYHSCEQPCSTDDECGQGSSWCEGDQHWVTFFWCTDEGYCTGAGGFSECTYGCSESGCLQPT